MFLPMIWVNLFRGNEIQNYKKLRNEYLEVKTNGEMMAFYQKAIKWYPDNPVVHLDYIVYFDSWRIESDLKKLAIAYQERIQLNPDDERTKQLSLIGYGITGIDEFIIDEPLSTSDTNDALYQFAKGVACYLEGDYLNTQYHYIKAMQHPDLEDVAFRQLKNLWFQHFTEQDVRKMAYNYDVAKVMNFSYRRNIYIQDGAWNWYLINALQRDFLSADIFGYIAVLLSMGVWILFIFKMLFIQLDKWKLILPLFLLGSILPILVYVFSDLLSYLYSIIDINWNHQNFWYNFINIGMVEELVKFIPWFIIYLIFKKHFSKPVHFMLLPIISALGFAFAENLIYVNSNDYEILFIRSTICVAIHITCSSIIGYALYRGNLQNEKWKTFLFVLGGFLLASLIHGLYDYYIFTGYRLLNILVFLFGLHIFILLINNSLNFSKITDKNATKKIRNSGVFLMTGLFVVFLCQYMIVAVDFGKTNANIMFEQNLIYALVTMIYLFSMFRKIKLKPGVMLQFSFADMFGQFFVPSKSNSKEINYIQKSFRLFAPKTNIYIGSQLPVNVSVIDNITIQGDANWLLVGFEKPIYLNSCYSREAVLKTKDNSQELFMDKVEVMLLFIPDYNAFINRDKHHSSDFIYSGRVYSRPNSEF